MMVGVIGIVTGSLLSVPWYLFMTRVGIDLSGLMGDVHSSGVLVETVLKLRLYPETALVILIGVLALTMLAGLYPAYQAGRDPPVETLRQV